MTFFRSVWDLVLPASCPVCGGPGVRCCALAAESVSRADVPVPCWSVGSYSGALRRAVLSFKEKGARVLGVELGALLASLVLREFAPPFVVVPIPMRAAAFRVRGFDQVRLLADVVGERLAVPVAPILRVRGARADSVGLSARERRRRVSGSFVVTGSVTGSPVLIVDDVVTSGATVVEAVRVLRHAGMNVAGVATIASA